MADTSFSDRSGTTAGTSIVAAWLNQVNKWLFWGSKPNYGTTTGSANAQVLTLASGSLYAAGSESDGDEFSFTAGFSNAAAMTLQVKPSGGSNTARAVQVGAAACSGGEVVAGSTYKVVRLGATWQLFSSNASSSQPFSDATALVKNAADPTRKLSFSLTGLTTATTRTWTVPDSDTKIPIASQTITWAGLTGARTYTMPDANLTIPAVTAKGDMWSASASGVMAKTAVGSNGQAWIAASGATGGATWGLPTGMLMAGTVLTQNPYAGSATATQAHGLGAQPAFVTAYLECLTGENGYSAGDRVHMPPASGSGSAFSVSSDGTNLYLSTQGNTPLINNKASAATVNITAGNWKLIATPYKVNA